MIQPISTELNKELQEKIDFKTKPIGSLGTLETFRTQGYKSVYHIFREIKSNFEK